MPHKNCINICILHGLTNIFFSFQCLCVKCCIFLRHHCRWGSGNAVCTQLRKTEFFSITIALKQLDTLAFVQLSCWIFVKPFIFMFTYKREDHLFGELYKRLLAEQSAVTEPWISEGQLPDMEYLTCTVVPKEFFTHFTFSHGFLFLYKLLFK